MAEPTRLWVLTGPSGGGKSAAASFLAARGAEVIDADRVGHEVLRDSEAIPAIAERFGQDVLRDGAIDRSRLGAIVFADPDELAALERLVHPRLSARLTERLAAVEAPLAVVEAAIYFRLPPFATPDAVILVTAPEEIRRRRLLRGGLSEAAAEARITAQRPLLKDWERSDIVIDNESGLEDLYAALQDLLRNRLPDGSGMER